MEHEEKHEREFSHGGIVRIAGCEPTLPGIDCTA